MITKGTSKVASDTTAGSSSIVAEIYEAFGESDSGKVSDLIEDESSIVNHCQSVYGQIGCSEQRQLQGVEVG